MVAISMMSTKLATPGLLKIKLSWNKGYDFIIFVRDVTIKFLSHESNHIVVVVMWPKFGEKLSQPQFYKDLIRKTNVFERWSSFKFNNLGLAIGMDLKFSSSVAKA